MVVFEPEHHRYKNPETGEYYKSVSTLLSEYKKPFDSNFFSSIVAKREGVSKKVILERWAKNTEAACVKGKVIHSTIEKFIKNDDYDIEDLTVIEAFKKVFVKDDIKVFHSEKLLFNDEDKIAGTSDCIADAKRGDVFDVYDFKTNKEFTFTNKYHEYLLKPISHLQNCHFNSYALQLSLYAYLYSRMTNKTVRCLSLFYYDGEKFTRINVPYMYWDVVILLRHHKSIK